MAGVSWPQWKTHLHQMLYPNKSPEELLRRMQSQADEFQSLFQYLNWNHGRNLNLKQLLDEAFPSYHEWINTHVMPSLAMFRGPPIIHSVSRSNLTASQTLVELISDIRMSGFDNAPLPSSTFVGDNSAPNELALNLTTVATTMHQWMSMAKSTVSTGTYVYICPGWTPAAVIGYLDAFALVVCYTAREYVAMATTTEDHAHEIVNLTKIVHTVCCTLAGLYQLVCPAPISFVPNTFIRKDHPRKDILPIRTRIVKHPADPDGGVSYVACSLVDITEEVYGLLAIKPTPLSYAPPWGGGHRRAPRNRADPPFLHPTIGGGGTDAPLAIERTPLSYVSPLGGVHRHAPRHRTTIGNNGRRPRSSEPGIKQPSFRLATQRRN